GIRIAITRVGANRLHPGPVGGCAACLPAAADQHPGAPLPGVIDQLLSQPTLADARLAADQEQPAPPGKGLLEAREQLRELALPSDEEGPRRWRRSFRGLSRSRGSGRKLEEGVVNEDRLLQALQLLTGLESELFGEESSPAPIRRKGLRLPAAAVERKHQLGPQLLPQGVLRDKPLQLCDQLRVPA